MLFKHLNRLQQPDPLIRQRRTGNAEEPGGKAGMKLLMVGGMRSCRLRRYALYPLLALVFLF